MAIKHTVAATLLVFFSCASSANSKFHEYLEKRSDITEALSSAYAAQSQSKQKQFTDDDCPKFAQQPYGDNGLNSGYRSTHCYVSEFNGNKVESYIQTSPDGSTATGFSWSFE